MFLTTEEPTRYKLFKFLDFQVSKCDAVTFKKAPALYIILKQTFEVAITNIADESTSR